jgi:hypothetical protein
MKQKKLWSDRELSFWELSARFDKMMINSWTFWRAVSLYNRMRRLSDSDSEFQQGRLKDAAARLDKAADSDMQKEWRTNGR